MICCTIEIEDYLCNICDIDIKDETVTRHLSNYNWNVYLECSKTWFVVNFNVNHMKSEIKQMQYNCESANLENNTQLFLGNGNLSLVGGT